MTGRGKRPGRKAYSGGPIDDHREDAQEHDGFDTERFLDATMGSGRDEIWFGTAARFALECWWCKASETKVRITFRPESPTKPLPLVPWCASCWERSKVTGGPIDVNAVVHDPARELEDKGKS